MSGSHEKMLLMSLWSLKRNKNHIILYGLSDKSVEEDMRDEWMNMHRDSVMPVKTEINEGKELRKLREDTGGDVTWRSCWCM